MGPSVSDSVAALAPFELGFDYEATAKTKILTGVIENSSAWKAGLRNGQKWRGGSIYFDKIQKPALVYIEEEGKIREIKYMPTEANTVLVRQFYLQ